MGRLLIPASQAASNKQFPRISVDLLHLLPAPLPLSHTLPSLAHSSTPSADRLPSLPPSLLLQKQKQRAREQLEAATKTRESVRGSLKDLKANMKFTTVEAIDEAIAAAEYRMEHHSLSLGEEKKVLEDIKKLRGSRAMVAQYSEKLEQLGQVGGGRGGVSVRWRVVSRVATCSTHPHNRPPIPCAG